MNNAGATFVPIRAASVGELTVSLLETDPRGYYQKLKSFASSDDPDTREAIREKLNEEPYESWHSNHLLSLSRLVGKMNQRAIDVFGVGGSFYGSKNIEGVSSELAISLLKLMMVCGGDISAKDYYGYDVIQILQQGEEDNNFYRTGEEVDSYFNWVQKIHSFGGNISEGIPPSKT